MRFGASFGAGPKAQKPSALPIEQSRRGGIGRNFCFQKLHRGCVSKWGRCSPPLRTIGPRRIVPDSPLILPRFGTMGRWGRSFFFCGKRERKTAQFLFFLAQRRARRKTTATMLNSIAPGAADGTTDVGSNTPRVGGGVRVPSVGSRLRAVSPRVATAAGEESREMTVEPPAATALTLPAQLHTARAASLAACECGMSVKTRCSTGGRGRASLCQAPNIQQSLRKIWLPEQDSNLRPFD
jgi:hypothetical protein